MLEVEHLAVSYGPTRILEDVSFAVPERRVGGLLGGNGASETTMSHVRRAARALPPNKKCHPGDRPNRNEKGVKRNLLHLPLPRGRRPLPPLRHGEAHVL